MKLVLLVLAVTLAVPLAAGTTAEPPAPAIPALSPDQLTAALGAGAWLIVEFGGEHCIPCKAMQPVLQELRDTLGDKVVIRNFWIQEHPDVARAHKIMVMPTQIVFDPKGTEVLRHQGVYPLADFRAALAGKGLS